MFVIEPSAPTELNFKILFIIIATHILIK